MAATQRVQQLLYPEDEERQRAAQKTKAYLVNPFLRRDGSLANPYLNYQSMANDGRISDRVKGFITQATGIVPRVTNQMNSLQNQAGNSGMSPAWQIVTGQSGGGNNTQGYSGAQGSAGSANGDFAGRIGSISAKYESSGWNPGKVSSGDGDYGGVSYGMPQFSTTQGSAQSFVNWLKQVNPEMGSAFGNSKPGSAEFTNAWKNVAARYGDSFGNLQNQYAYNNFVMPFIKRAKEKTGVDLSATPALRELAYSTAVQFGSGGTYALGNINPNMSERDIINTVYDNKINNYQTYFRGSSAETQESVRNRFINERRDLLNMAG